MTDPNNNYYSFPSIYAFLDSILFAAAPAQMVSTRTSDHGTPQQQAIEEFLLEFATDGATTTTTDDEAAAKYDMLIASSIHGSSPVEQLPIPQQPSRLVCELDQSSDEYSEYLSDEPELVTYNNGGEVTNTDEYDNDDEDEDDSQPRESRTQTRLSQKNRQSPAETVSELLVPDETVSQEAYEPVPDEPAVLQDDIEEFFGLSAKRKHDHVYGTATSRQKPRTERPWLSEDTNNDGVVASFLVNEPVPDEPAVWELQPADDSIEMTTSRRRAWMTSPLLSVTVKANNATSDAFSASFLVNQPIPDEPPVWEHHHCSR